MFRFFKMGNEPNFYQLLREQAELAHKAALLLHQGCKDCDGIGKASETIEDVEEEGEEKRRIIGRLIDTTFVTPLDKEDLDHLARYLHRVLDAIHGAARRLALYPVGACRDDVPPMVQTLGYMTEALVKALTMVEQHQTWHLLEPVLRGVHQLEKDADHALREALVRLFKDKALDPVSVIQWKEIYEWVEDATDRCHDVATFLERVGVKYA